MTTQPKRLKNPFFTPNEYSSASGRLYFYDNAKFILIFLVVMGHAISAMKDKHPIYFVIWSVTNSLHMPCLIFISGFFAKNYISAKGLKIQRPFTYFVLYAVSQAAFTLYEIFILKNDVVVSIFQARQALWFLQCLVGWYILLPLIDKFNPKYVIIGAFVFGLIIGYDSKVGDLAALSRMFVHLPFFIAGYYCTEETIRKLFNWKVRLAGVVIIIFTFIICYIFIKEIDTKIITCNMPYSRTNLASVLPIYIWWFARAMFYLFAVGLIVSFLSLTPRCKTFYTKFGSRTLQVYILHKFLHYASEEFGWWKALEPTFFGRLSIVLIALVVTFILSLRVFEFPFEALQKIKIPKLLLKPDRQ